MLRDRAPSCFILCTFLLLVTEGNGPATAQTKVEQIENLLTRFHDYELFNGSVLVAEEGKVLYKGGFGQANMAWDIRNTPDTKFRIASTTKQFTAALMLTVVEAGQIDLDGKVTDYLPDYPATQGDRVTIHHLLSHTSGIPSYTSLPGFMSDEVRDPYEPDALLALFSDLDLEFEPGMQWAYSNSGYVLLGAIIEVVTGKPYDEALRDQILDPLGLDDTGYGHYGKVITHQATGYVKTPDGYEQAPYLDTSVPYSAGMMYSTVEDLFKWDQSLYEKGPFRKTETKTLMFSPHAALPDALPADHGLPPAYGYGWFVGSVPIAGDTVKVIEHGGSIFGFTTGFWRMPEERKTVIIMDNTSSGNVREMGRGVMSILYGEAAPMPKHPKDEGN